MTKKWLETQTGINVEVISESAILVSNIAKPKLCVIYNKNNTITVRDKKEFERLFEEIKK